MAGKMRVRTTGLMVGLAALCVAAGPVRAQEVPAAADEALKTQRCPKPSEFASVFSFGYGDDYCMPTNDAQFEALLALVKEGGFNVIHTTYTEKRLELCKKYGVKMMLDYLSVSQHHVYKSVDKAQALAEKLRGNPDVWGYNIWNEGFGKMGPGRERDILNVRRWDPTHPAYAGTYRTGGMRYLATSDVLGYYDYHWSRGYGHHFANLMAYSGTAAANNSSFYRWIESKASHSRDENVRKGMYTLNTSIACGMKGALWFLGTDFVAGMYARDLKGSFDKHEGPFQWNPVGEDAVKVNKEIMPLAREIMKIGNPASVFSTPTTKDMGNADLPADQAGKVPGGLAPFPADFWVQPAGGEFVMGVFKDDEKRDAIFVANHNALAPQDVKLQFAKPVKVSLFNRKEAKWTAVPAGGNAVSFKLEGGGGELLRVE